MAVLSARSPRTTRLARAAAAAAAASLVLGATVLGAGAATGADDPGSQNADSVGHGFIYTDWSPVGPVDSSTGFPRASGYSAATRDGARRFTIQPESPSRVVELRRTSQIPNEAEPVPIGFLVAANTENTDPETADCLWDNGTAHDLGYVEECARRTVTLTFDRPVIDPVIWTSPGTLTPEAVEGNTMCYLGWQDTLFSAVDGAPVDESRLTLLSRMTETTEFTGLELRHSEIGHDPTLCTTAFRANPRGFDGVQIKGKVTSVTLTAIHRSKITRVPFSGGMYQPKPVRGGGVPALSITASVPLIDLQIEKTTETHVGPGGLIEWQINVTNASRLASHGFILRDAVPAEVTNVELVDPPPGCVLAGRDLECRRAPAGWTIQDDDGFDTIADIDGGNPLEVDTVLDGGATFGPIVLRGTAPTRPGSTVVNTVSVAGVDADPDTDNNRDGTTTVVDDSVWGVSKVARVEGGVFARPGGVITFEVSASSTSGQVDDVVLRDDLTDVLGSSDIVAGSVKLVVAGAEPVVLPDPTLASPVIVAGPFDLPAGQSARLTYQVRVHEDAWSANLVNTVTGEAVSPPQTCGVDAVPADPDCSTQTRTAAKVRIVKQGLVDGLVVGLDGAAFELLADDGGAPGAVLTDPAPTPTAGTPGGFDVLGLEPGTYWLRETQAPQGYELLATAVQFTVQANGTVSIVSPADAPQISASGGTITVNDVTALRMPEAGSSGTAWLAAVGVVLLAGAALVAVRLRKRTSAAPEPSHGEGGPDTQH